VEFSEDGKKLLAVTEKRMGHLGTICVYDIRYGEDLTDQADELSLKITCEESKATVAAWSFLDKYIIAGHEDGSVSQYDAKVQETPLISGNGLANACFCSWGNSILTSKSTSTICKSMTYKWLQTGRTSSLQGKTKRPRYA
jgi:hypothetical protein